VEFEANLPPSAYTAEGQARKEARGGQPVTDQLFSNIYEDDRGNTFEVITHRRAMTKQELLLAVQVFLTGHKPAHNARNRTFSWEQLVWPGERD
jgi:hypothetical protein